MDLVNRLMVGIAYILVGIVIGGVCFAAFRFYGASGEREDVAVVSPGDAEGQRERDRSSATGSTRAIHIQQIYAQRAQITRLQRLLDQKTALLDRKTILLDEKTAEQQALRTELAQAIDLLETLAAESMFEGEETNGAGQDKEQLKAEVERLRTDSEKSQAVDREQQSELDLLVMELAATDEKIMLLQAEAEAEFAALLEQKDTVEMAVSAAFAQMGEDAVPVLIDHLTHEKPDIRRWAAMTLGEIGPPARDAIPPLLDTLRDREQSVCDAARIALKKIDRMGQ